MKINIKHRNMHRNTSINEGKNIRIVINIHRYIRMNENTLTLDININININRNMHKNKT